MDLCSKGGCNIPQHILKGCLDRLPDDMKTVIEKFNTSLLEKRDNGNI